LGHEAGTRGHRVGQQIAELRGQQIDRREVPEGEAPVCRTVWRLGDPTPGVLDRRTVLQLVAATGSTRASAPAAVDAAEPSTTFDGTRNSRRNV